MEFVNYKPRMLPYLVEQCVFGVCPFFLYDIGCAGGLDRLWRLFGDQLAGVGFDPQQSEVERLRKDESNSNVAYVATLIGLDDAHDFHQRRKLLGNNFYEYFNAFERTSAAAIWRKGGPLQSNVLDENVTQAKVTISEYARAQAKYVDFIKIDTDGHDFEALLSAEDIIKSHGVLGFMIEAPFTGAHQDTENSFHNIDRLMRKNGFIPYVLASRQYSRAALPARFCFNIPAETVTGPTLWADAVYLRDGASPQYHEFWREELSAVALLKLAALHELFRLPDCAAELIALHHRRIANIIDPDKLLDLLTPPLDGKQLSYQSYVTAFRETPERFFPIANSSDYPIRALGSWLSRFKRAVSF